MDDEDQKLERIRKLLAKAEKAGTPEEADTYNAKAAELMARHSIDSAMLAASNPQADTIGRRRLEMTDPYSMEKATLAGCIAATMNCRCVSHYGRGRGQVRAVTVLGFESDLRRVELTFTSLLLQATRSVVHQRPPEWSSESTTAFRRSYLIGFSAEVHRRLEQAAERAKAEHETASPPGRPSAELVLADRKTLVDHAYAQAFPGARKLRARRLAGSGYTAGITDARRADVGLRPVGPPRRELGPGHT